MNWHIINFQNNGQCEKYLVCIDNRYCIEIAAIKHNHQTHLCMPTQLGCPIQCSHCATTYSKHPYLGNLDYNTLLSICTYFINKYSNNSIILSFSGHGEPLMNWDNVFKVACKCRNKVKAVYVTTIGIASVLKDIIISSANFITFYFSIHAGSDSQRNKLIPVNNNITNLTEIINFTNSYGSQGGKVVWNYMVHSKNCSNSDAEELISILKITRVNFDFRFTALMNISNEQNKYTPITQASKEQFDIFVDSVTAHKKEIPNISFRISNIEGEEIQVACGQMRAHYYNHKEQI